MEVEGDTCSRRGTALGGCGPATLFWVTCLERARTAVTLVMKLSSGSTLALVTLMMKASHVTFSSFSSSFLLSTFHTTNCVHHIMLCSLM